MTAVVDLGTEDLARILHQAELGYLARGWAVFPLLPRSKDPFPRSRGFKDATLDPDEVTRRRDRYPKANIGIATGAVSGLYVVDIDPGKGGMDTWAMLEATHPSYALTLEHETGSGGSHLLFTYPDTPGPRDDDAWPNTKKRLGPGVDTRGEGGYIMAPPSVHPCGRAYRWCDATTETQPMPWWLLELLDDTPATAGPVQPILPPGERADRYWLAALRGEIEELTTTPKGSGRNARLHLAACRIGRLEAHGARLDVAEDALAQAGAAIGIREADARRQVRNGFTWGRTHPRGGAA